MKPERQGSVDPEVAALMKQQEHKAQRRGMTNTQRKKADQDAGRARLYLDVPPKVQADLKAIAADEDCSVSSLAAFFLVDAIGRYERGELPIGDHKAPARNLRFNYVIELPTESG